MAPPLYEVCTFSQESEAQAGTRWVSARLYPDITWEAEGLRGLFGLQRQNLPPKSCQLSRAACETGPCVWPTGDDQRLGRQYPWPCGERAGAAGASGPVTGPWPEVEDYGFAWQAGLRQGAAAGGDLQGGRGHTDPRPDDRPATHLPSPSRWSSIPPFGRHARRLSLSPQQLPGPWPLGPFLSRWR